MCVRLAAYALSWNSPDIRPLSARPSPVTAVHRSRASQQLADFIDGGFAADEPINLFGFSMGGLIKRDYLQKMDGWRRVRKFVTAASPHRGTMTAKLATYQAALQMRPDSEFILDLNSDLSVLERGPRRSGYLST